LLKLLLRAIRGALAMSCGVSIWLPPARRP
jgi:hypothetical protein